MQTSIRLRNNIFLDKLQLKGDIECYDRIMDSRPNYLTIVYTFVMMKFRQRLKIITSSKVKSILKNFSHRMMMIIFAIL
jgi:hypothetical protein